MPKNPDKQYQSKARLQILLRMFYELTDEDHGMTKQEILDYLEQNEVKASVRTLQDDISLLNKLGFDIVTYVSRPNRYFMGRREFELPEIQMLIDAVSSSRSITKKKSRELIDKLCGFASIYQKEDLRKVTEESREKSGNEDIYYTVDTINSAIHLKKKVAFQYLEYTVKKKVTLRNKGEVYELSPYMMYWNEDNYYVIGWSEKHENVSTFRVDRIYRPKVLETDAVEMPEFFNINAYSDRIFDMFGGDHASVKLECENKLMKYIIDRFGEKTEITEKTDRTFETIVDVELSPTFYSWIFQFAGRIRILAPARAVNELVSMANTIIAKETL